MNETDYKKLLEDYLDYNIIILDTEEDELRRYFYNPEENEGKGSIQEDLLKNLSELVRETPPEEFIHLFEQEKTTAYYDFGKDESINNELAQWFADMAEFGKENGDKVLTCESGNMKVREAINELVESMRQTMQIYEIVKNLTLEDYVGTQDANFGEGPVVLKDYLGTSGENDVCVGVNTSTKELYISINNGDFQSVKKDFCADLREKINACNKLLETRQAVER